MNDFAISFGDAPWERWLDARKAGDSLNAVQLLTLLEDAGEEAVEDAFAAIEEKGLMLDVSQLPNQQYVGQAAVRLRQERQLAEAGLPLDQLPPNDPLRLYLEELSGVPVCGDAQLLAQDAARGDVSAQEMLTNLCLSRVVELALEFVGYGVLLMDLIQEGSLGLWQAVQSYREGDFDAYRDCCIRGSMARAVTIQARNNGVGQKLRQALEDYRAVDGRLLSQLGRNPTLEEIALEMHVTPEDAAMIKRNLDDATLLRRANPDPEPESPEEENQAVEDTAYFQMRQRIEELLSALEERDAKLLTARFGLDGKPPLSPEEAGLQLGLTPKEVLEREAKALAKLRQEG